MSRHTRWSILCLMVVTFCLSACKPASKETTSTPKPPAPKPVSKEWFSDVTDQLGIRFAHNPGDPSDYFMPRSLGSGVALLDYNRDGLMDIYCLQNTGPDTGNLNQLFRQKSDGTFENTTESSGLGIDGHNMGVAVGDVTNDGFPDVLVVGYLSSRLFINVEGSHFKEVTREAGIDNPAWGMSASFLDFDRDGWLDIVIANYIEYAPSVACTNNRGEREFCGPDGFPSAVPKLYRNSGNMEKGSPLFEDVTTSSGLARVPGPGLGVACFDVDGDGWTDIFFADDAKPNRLLINQNNGQFQEEGLKRGIALDAMGQTRANMGVGVGDVDNDGLLDLFVTHLATERHTLWRQGPRGMFSDRTASFGLNATSWRGTGFGALMGDFNNDGQTDIAFVNGDIRAKMNATIEPDHPLGPFWQKYAQRNQLFMHEGATTFKDISDQNPSFCGDENVGRGLVSGDINNDGVVDMILSGIAAPVKVLQGNPETNGHWLIVQATLPNAGNRDDIGAEIIVSAAGKTWHRWLNPGMSYMCSNDPRLHFGLGDMTQIDSIRVIWSDGGQEDFPGGDTDRMVSLQKGSGTPSKEPL